MSILSFRRVDLEIFVRRTEDDGATVLIGHPDSYEELHFGFEKASNLPPHLLAEPVFNHSFLAWQKRLDEGSGQLKQNEVLLPRVTIDIDDLEFASQPWESSLAERLSTSSIVVRVSQMRPRWVSVPFTVPLRILNVDPANPGALPFTMRNLIGKSQPDEIASQAVKVHERQFFELSSGLTETDWPTVEIIHFEQLPSLIDEALFKTSVPEQAGTLGWFARVGDLWKTRLVIIECNGRYDFVLAQRLATALINRGGPAVLVIEQSPNLTSFLREFYWNLLHDFPVDTALLRIGHMDHGPLSLFAGARREDALRISNLGLALVKLEERISAAKASPSPPESEVDDLVRTITTQNVIERKGERLTYDDAGKIVIHAIQSRTAETHVSEDMSLRVVGFETEKQRNELVSTINRSYPGRVIEYRDESGTRQNLKLKRDWTVAEVIDAVAKRGVVLPRGITKVINNESRKAVGRIEQSLSKLKKDWANFRFEFHEREGYVPVTERVSAMRADMNLKGPLPYESEPKLTEPRHVNASLWSDENDEGFVQLDQITTRLVVGKVYHLGIQIGPKDIRIRTFGETALIEEVFNWSPEMKGVWVEFAVTGIDFDVLGDPVRDLWLPRERPSEMIYFAVSPRTEGACRLRYCLYYKQNVIQSFRLAAIALTSQQQDLLPDVRRQQLSQALNLPEHIIGNAGYFSRLEYSLTTSVDSLETRPARLMSIVANDLDGQPVVTVKGSDDFRVLTPADLNDDITAVRDTFTDISANASTTEKNRLRWPYAFGKFAKQPETLEAALQKLAAAGWRLYDKIFRVKTQNRLGEALSKDPKVIHVAHILLEKVIPWAALYDRQYKPDMTEDDQLRPVDHGTCLAGLPDANGDLPVLECGKHPKCLLHPDQIKDREATPNSKHFVPETVACPLHFWGFKHIIEIPPQQVDEDGVSIPQPDFIQSGSSVQMITGANTSLKLWPKHLQGLNKFNWKAQALSAAALNKALKDADLDLIYLYCHAGGGRTDPAGYDPHLLFEDQQAKPQKIRSGDFPLAPEWAHHPLVFLNGCGTSGYTPDALSPFIKKLVGDLGAAGMIGTEITVWEELATGVAEDFLERFLARNSAGEALLAVRRTLLANNNPLGLVYTLYAPAHLKLKQ